MGLGPGISPGDVDSICSRRSSSRSAAAIEPGVYWFVPMPALPHEVKPPSKKPDEPGN